MRTPNSPVPRGRCGIKRATRIAEARKGGTTGCGGGQEKSLNFWLDFKGG